MIEYDFAIGLEYAQKEDGRYRIHLPYSCVLYLRGEDPTPSQNLELMLLPFYVMRYENAKLEDEKLCKHLYEEYALIQKYLEETYLQKGQEKAFRDVMELINRITDYIFSKEKMSERS